MTLSSAANHAEPAGSGPGSGFRTAAPASAPAAGLRACPGPAV